MRKRTPVVVDGVPILDGPTDLADDQLQLDEEDASLRLRKLVDATLEEEAAEHRVRTLQDDLKRAKATYRSAIRRRRELAFMERQRRSQRNGG